MTRIVKDPDVRRREIIDAAERLFNDNGYEETPVEEIIKQAGIAKGTFYYYFKSKEEILDAIVKRMAERIIRRAGAVAGDESLSSVEKMRIMLFEQNMEARREFESMKGIHLIKNVDMHQKIIVELVLQYAPILSSVVRQGISEGVFHTAHPLEATEYLLVASQFLFDPGIYPWSEADLARRAAAMQEIVESIYKAEPGSLGYISGLSSLLGHSVLNII
jgi:AcrR family transcriptional regulator